MYLERIKANYERVSQRLKHWDKADLALPTKEGRIRSFTNHLEYELLPLVRDDLPFQARLFMDLGHFHNFLDDFEKAVGWNKRAIQAYNRLKEGKNVLRCKIQLGDAYQNHGLLPQAVQLYQDVLKAPATALPEHQEMLSLTHWGLADCLRIQGKYGESNPHYENCLRICRELSENDGISNALWGLAYNALNMGNYREALKHIGEMEELHQDGLVDERQWAETLGVKGDTLRMMGEFTEAVACYEEAYRIIRMQEDAAQETWILWAWAQALLMSGEIEKSKTFHLRAFESARRLDDAWERTFTTQGLAEWHRTQGDLETAEGLFSESLKMATKNRFGMETTHAHLGLAETWRLQGKPDMETYEAALKDYQHKQIPWGIAHCYIGMALASLPQESAYQKNLQEARELAKSQDLPFELKEISRIGKSAKRDEIHPLCFP